MCFCFYIKIFLLPGWISFISSCTFIGFFLYNSFRCSVYSTMARWNRYFYLYHFIVFMFKKNFFVLTTSSRIILSKSGKIKYLYILPDIRAIMFRFSLQISCWLYIFLHICLTKFRKFPHITSLLLFPHR